MSTTPAPFHSESVDSSDQTVRAALEAIESFLADSAGPTFDADYFERLSFDLQRLHACMRSQHSAAGLSGTGGHVPPEYAGEFERLQGEHLAILGQIDRVVRLVDSMPDRPMEDREVFFLRIREMIATLRRHEAEEDRLLCLAIWHDTGGES